MKIKRESREWADYPVAVDCTGDPTFKAQLLADRLLEGQPIRAALVWARRKACLMNLLVEVRFDRIFTVKDAVEMLRLSIDVEKFIFQLGCILKEGYPDSLPIWPREIGGGPLFLGALSDDMEKVAVIRRQVWDLLYQIDLDCVEGHGGFVDQVNRIIGILESEERNLNLPPLP